MQIKEKSWAVDIFWLTFFIVIFFGFLLGIRALSVPDEARYTEIPREMLLFHDVITPHLDGVKYFEKPPLLYWIQAGMLSLFGFNEWVVRIPTAVMGLLGCLGVYASGRWMFGRQAGILAALVLATSPLYFAMAHSVTLDMTVTLWLTMTLLCFIVAVDLPRETKARRVVAYGMYVGAALAVMSKGLIGIVLPGFVMLSWFFMFGRWREISALYLPSGICIFLAIVLPWHVLVQLKNPEFFHFYFVEQHFTRYFTKAMGRYQPFYWFVPVLLIGFFPWVIFFFARIKSLFPSFWATRATKHREIFLLLWAIEIFFFFSFSDSKLIPYILPCFPPLALLVGLSFSASLKEDVSARASLFSPEVPIALFCALLIFLALSAHFWFPQLPEEALYSLMWMALPLLLMAAGILFFKSTFSKICCLLVTQILFLWSLIASVPHIDHRSIKPLALEINRVIQPGDIIASYGNYAQDLPVYTKQLVWIVDWTNELTFGLAHQPQAKNWVFEPSLFWQRWEGKKRIFALMDKDDYNANKDKYRIFVLATDANNMLVSNRES